MSDTNPDDEARNDQPTDEKEAATTRRTFVKGLAAAAAVGGSASLFGQARAQESLDSYLPPDGTTELPAGEYSWGGDGLSVGSGDAVVGGGEAGDVVWNLESGTMEGTVSGRLENVVVRGDNPEAKAGINLAPGGVIDGFVWPEGGGQQEDRALYHPEGGGRTEVRNAAIAWMSNNGAYIDKAPVTMENVAAVNNNIANVRVGHRDGTSNPSGQTTHIRNTLVAVTQTPRHDSEAGSHSRGIRLRHPGHLVIENCYVVFLDVDGTADLVELHDGAAGSTVEIRNTHFYNDSGGRIVRDKSGGQMDVTIEDCTITGSGNREVEPEFSGNGFTEESVSVPLPSEITGYDAADEIEGVGPDVGPFSGDATSSGGTDEEENDDDDGYEHTLVLHADPENPLSADAIAGDFDMDITVSGAAALGEDAEPGSDGVATNDDGSSTITVNDLMPDELDSFHFDGEVTDYVVDDGYGVDVSVDGQPTTFEELANGEFDYSGTGTPDGDASGDGSSDGNGSSGDNDSSDGDDSSGGNGSSGGDALSKSLVVDGQSGDEVTTYTFTVTGDVERDPENSTSSGDGLTWSVIEDVARDGKVIGLVGDGVDVFRYSGDVTDLTVDGDAAIYMERND